MNIIHIQNIILLSVFSIMIVIAFLLSVFRNEKHLTTNVINRIKDIDLDNEEVDKYLTENHIDTIKAIFEDVEKGVVLNFIENDHVHLISNWCGNDDCDNTCNLCDASKLNLDCTFMYCDKRLLRFKNITIYLIKYRYELLHYIYLKNMYKDEYYKFLSDHQKWEFKHDWHTHTEDGFSAYALFVCHRHLFKDQKILKNKGISNYKIVTNCNTLKKYNTIISCIEEYKNTIDDIKEQKRLEEKEKKKIDDLKQQLKDLEIQKENEKKENLKLFTKSYLELTKEEM